jgi:hypothetical protein
MRNHFDYLTKDDEAAFFQKLAVDEASVKASHVAPEAMRKLASAKSPFEKVAVRLDRDLDLLKTAGECGLNAGMMRRADAYVDVLLTHAGLNNDELGEVFDKVAAAAIEADLLAAYEQLCGDVPDEYVGLVDDILVKAGADLTELALLEKQAKFGLGGLGRASHMAEEAGQVMRRGSHGAAGIAGELAGGGSAASKMKAGLAGVGAATKEIAQTTAGKATAPFKALGDKFRTARTARIARTRGELASSLETARKASTAPGLRGTTGKAMASSLEGTIAKNKSSALAQAGKAADKTKESMGLAKKPAASAATLPTAKAPAAESGGGAKPPKTKEPEAAAGAESPHASEATEAPPGGSEGKPPGFMDAWKKATTKGWKALSEEERGALIRGGVTAAVVYRVAAGKGAITGGDGII